MFWRIHVPMKMICRVKMAVSTTACFVAQWPGGRRVRRVMAAQCWPPRCQTLPFGYVDCPNRGNEAYCILFVYLVAAVRNILESS